MRSEVGQGSGAVDAPFFEGLAAGELRLPRCSACRAWTWPARWRCGLCGSWNFTWEATSAHGTVHSFARTHHATRPEFRDLAPYTSVLVSLEAAGGVRLLGLLVGGEDGLAIGAAVRGLIEIQEGTAVLRWSLCEEAAP